VHPQTWRRVLCRALLIGGAGLFAPALVHAHFILLTPDSWMSQDAYGLPEKMGPCGNEAGGTPTGKLTAFHPGDTVTVTINEVIMHPGHYRVALAVNGQSELPADPKVTPKGGDPCGSVVVQKPPIFPVLADDMLPHTQAFMAPQMFTVTLPADVACSKCTLQVVEYMSSHPAPCFYHHCADISIDAVSTTSTTTPVVPTGGNTTTTVPCDTPRCSVDAVVQGPACGSEAIPAAILGKLDRAPDLLQQAGSSPPGKARVLRGKAKRLLRRAGGSALRASRGKTPKLSAGCAASIKATTDQLVGAL
jgi:hypothetical protein